MKKYILEITETENGLKMKGECNGFNAFELVGFLSHKIEDIMRQIRGEIRPNMVRDFIEQQWEEITNGNDIY